MTLCCRLSKKGCYGAALTEIGRCCGMEINVEKSEIMIISRQSSPAQVITGQKKKQPENMQYLKYFRSRITNDAISTSEVKSMTAMAKEAFNKKKALYSIKLDIYLRTELLKCYIYGLSNVYWTVYHCNS